MVIYSRFNCRQHVLENVSTKQIRPKDKARAVRRMKSLRFDEAWLARRMALFEQFTYPSVLAQTDQDFKWVGLVHQDSPQWLFDDLSHFHRLQVVPVEMDIDAVIRGGKSINLDTDDALAADFVEQARKVDFEGETIFPNGACYRIMTDHWIGVTRPNAHFNIVQHPELTVLDFSHGMTATVEKQLVNIRRPMWLEVIHEENISNKLRTTSADRDMGWDYGLKHFKVNKS